jgi:hypothetical protein
MKMHEKNIQALLLHAFRRSGKSVTLSMLEALYSKKYGD